MCQEMKFDLSLIKRGDTLLTRNEGRKVADFFGNRIEKQQLKAGFMPEHACYTHIEVIGPPPTSVCAAPPRVREVNFLERYKGRYIIITRFKEYQNDIQGADVAFWAATTCNEKYDYPGVFAFVMKWFKQKASWWFCAEDWMYSLRKVIPSAFKKEVSKPSKTMPAHGLLPLMEIIWEGQILK